MLVPPTRAIGEPVLVSLRRMLVPWQNVYPGQRRGKRADPFHAGDVLEVQHRGHGMEVILSCLVREHQRHIADGNIARADTVKGFFRCGNGVLHREEFPDIFFAQEQKLFMHVKFLRSYPVRHQAARNGDSVLSPRRERVRGGGKKKERGQLGTVMYQCFLRRLSLSIRTLQALLLPLAIYSSSVTQSSAPKEQARTHAGFSPAFTRSLHPSHFSILPSDLR